MNGGREGRPIGAYELAKAVEELGAGEILLNCIDCDGKDDSSMQSTFNNHSLPNINIIFAFSFLFSFNEKPPTTYYKNYKGCKRLTTRSLLHN